MMKLFAAVAGLSAAAVTVLGSTSAPDVTSRGLQEPQPPQRQTELVLSLTNPGTQPRVGVPDFTVTGASATLGDLAKTIADVLWADLEFEREFYMIPRTASAGIPAAPADKLPFDRWTSLGADFVLLGHVREAGDRLTVEVRVVSTRGTPPGQQVFGQSFEGCTAASPRYCAHYIADDMHKKIRQLDGVARTRIAFSSDRDGQRRPDRFTGDTGIGKEIYLMDYDGAAPRRVTANQHVNTGPFWGPDGRSLAYASWMTRFPDVYLLTLDGRPATRPAGGNDRVHNHSPAISPDGSQIAFVSNRSGQTGYLDIWVVNRDGSNARNLTPGTERWSEGAPTWSPGGNQIAFTSDRTGVNQIYVMNADGTGVRRLTFGRHSDRPTWSRLNFIAYTLWHEAGQDIGVIDLNNLTPRVITDGKGRNSQPTVSPNGRHIAFVTSRWGRDHLAVVDYDGKNIRRLTEAGNNTYPNWSPLPGRQ